MPDRRTSPRPSGPSTTPFGMTRPRPRPRPKRSSASARVKAEQAVTAAARLSPDRSEARSTVDTSKMSESSIIVSPWRVMTSGRPVSLANAVAYAPLGPKHCTWRTSGRKASAAFAGRTASGDRWWRPGASTTSWWRAGAAAAGAPRSRHGSPRSRACGRRAGPSTPPPRRPRRPGSGPGGASTPRRRPATEGTHSEAGLRGSRSKVCPVRSALERRRHGGPTGRYQGGGGTGHGGLTRWPG